MSPITALRTVFDDIGDLAVAVSGGVDSMTLSYVAHRHAPGRVSLFHAVSPAVPGDATRRVQAYAAREGWDLKVVTGKEFDDPNYRQNPVNRCFFCKTNLYETIKSLTDACVVSGTNTDDLSDFRPGLTAARDHSVRHPFVEAGIDKAAVRSIAREFDLHDLAELPAAPCLASRIETGLSIVPDVLTLVDRAEQLIRTRVAASSVRVRVRKEGIVVELNEDALRRESASNLSSLARDVGTLFLTAGHAHSVRIDEYKRGSAFLHAPTSGGA